MISLVHPFALADLPKLLLFADASDLSVIHALPLSLSLGQASLTLMGRGNRNSDAGVLAGFWTMTLEGVLTQDDRSHVSASLATDGGPALRVVAAEANVTLDLALTAEPGIGGKLEAAGWRGGPLSFAGDVGPQNAVVLRREWQKGLPNAQVRIDVAMTGMGTVTQVAATAQAFKIDLQPPGQARLSLQTATVEGRKSQATTLRFSTDASVVLARGTLASGIIYAGFDR